MTTMTTISNNPTTIDCVGYRVMSLSGKRLSRIYHAKQAALDFARFVNGGKDAGDAYVAEVNKRVPKQGIR